MTHTTDDGETKLNVVHQGALYDQYQIFMDADLTSDVVVAATVGSGAGVSGVSAALAAAGVTGPLGILATGTIATVIAVEIGWVQVSNDGHGVVIDVVIPNDYVDPNPSDIPYHYIQGQEHL